jgi:hypothetical protein
MIGEEPGQHNIALRGKALLILRFAFVHDVRLVRERSPRLPKYR